MNKKIIGLFVVIVIVIVGLFAVNAFLKDDMVEPGSSVIEDNTVVDEYVVTKDMIMVPDQAAGSEVFVERVELLEGGYVVIHRAAMEEMAEMDEEAAEDAEPAYSVGAIIGISEYLEAGVAENFIVALNEGETTEVDEKIYAMLHTEHDHDYMMDADMAAEEDMDAEMMDEGAEEMAEDEMTAEMMPEEGDIVPVDGDVAVTEMPDEEAMDGTMTEDMEEEAYSFNPAEDVPMVDAEGNIVMVLFTILADDVPGFETKL